MGTWDECAAKESEVRNRDDLRRRARILFLANDAARGEPRGLTDTMRSVLAGNKLTLGLVQEDRVRAWQRSSPQPDSDRKPERFPDCESVSCKEGL